MVIQDLRFELSTVSQISMKEKWHPKGRTKKLSHNLGNVVIRMTSEISRMRFDCENEEG